jgi:hypothetical protein
LSEGDHADEIDEQSDEHEATQTHCEKSPYR